MSRFSISVSRPNTEPAAHDPSAYQTQDDQLISAYQTQDGASGCSYQTQDADFARESQTQDAKTAPAHRNDELAREIAPLAD